MKIDVHTSSPILHMDVDADDFGRLFARMSDLEQVAVLRSMVEHMRPHSLQWDYIAIRLGYEENADLVRELRNIFTAEASR